MKVRISLPSLSSLIFALWFALILARGGGYLLAILPAFLPKLAYLAAWRIVGLGILPQGVACLKLAACRVIQVRASGVDARTEF